MKYFVALLLVLLSSLGGVYGGETNDYMHIYYKGFYLPVPHSAVMGGIDHDDDHFSIRYSISDEGAGGVGSLCDMTTIIYTNHSARVDYSFERDGARSLRETIYMGENLTIDRFLVYDDIFPVMLDSSEWKAMVSRYRIYDRYYAVIGCEKLSNEIMNELMRVNKIYGDDFIE